MYVFLTNIFFKLPHFLRNERFFKKVTTKRIKGISQLFVRLDSQNGLYIALGVRLKKHLHSTVYRVYLEKLILLSIADLHSIKLLNIHKQLLDNRLAF